MNQKENKLFWDLRAKDKTLNDKSVTNNDIFRRELEIVSLKECLNKRSGIKQILEIGCGSGYGTKQFLVRNDIKITATDYSEHMIDLAVKNNPDPAIEYKVADIINFAEVESYDCVISQRCLINILNKENQYKALQNMINSLRKGGTLLFLEGIQDGRECLNNERINYGLPPMPPVPFNVDFKVSILTNFIETAKCKIDERITHGTYDFVSRVLYPSIISPLEPKYEAKANEDIYKTILNNRWNDASFSRYSRTLLVVATKL